MEIITEWYTNVTKTQEHGPHDYVEKTYFVTQLEKEKSERSGWFDEEVKTASLFVAHQRQGWQSGNEERGAD